MAKKGVSSEVTVTINGAYDKVKLKKHLKDLTDALEAEIERIDTEDGISFRGTLQFKRDETEE